MTSSASATSSPRHDPLPSPRTSLCMYSSDDRRATSSHTLPLTAHSPHLYRPNRRAVSAVSTCTHKHNRAQLRCERRSRRRIHRGPSAALVTCPRPVSDPTHVRSAIPPTSTQCCATCRQCCAPPPGTHIRTLEFVPPVAVAQPISLCSRPGCPCPQSRGRPHAAGFVKHGSYHADPVRTWIPSARGSRQHADPVTRGQMDSLSFAPAEPAPHFVPV